MKRFTVVCSPKAEDQLAEIWPNAPDRDAVTWAQAQIEKRLTSDPKRHGEFVVDDFWRIEIPPLTEYFADRVFQGKRSRLSGADR